MDTDNREDPAPDDCMIVCLSPPPPDPSLSTPSGADNETPKQSASKIRISKAESEKRRVEREAKKVEEEAVRAEKRRVQEELKNKKAEELRLEKVRKAEEKARKAEELQLEKARKAEELQLEKARKAEEKARREEEKARKEAEYADKKAEQNKKKEQRQAAQQKQEMVHKQMANYMDKFFKPVDKSSGKETTTNTTNNVVIYQRCTEEFDTVVSKQNTQFVSDILESMKSMKKLEPDPLLRTRLNSDSNSIQVTTTSAYQIKTRYIHFPERYFNRPPYYGSFKKASAVYIDPLKPEAPIDNVDYTVDSEGEWEEPCKDGEELRSDAEDLSDADTADSDSDADSFIVPHGHLSDDELNEDEQQQPTSTKEAREAAKSHDWNKKVARRNQQRELKPIFGCIYDPILDEKAKVDLSLYLNQFRRIFVPKECYPRVEQEEKEEENQDETTTVKEEKAKRVSKKKSLMAKKALNADQVVQGSTVTNPPVTTAPNTPTTAKRTGSASNIVESSSPSKRRKTNANENCSIVDDLDVQMIDLEALNSSKNNVLEDSSNVTEVKSTPLIVISNDETKLDTVTSSNFTLLVPKRKQAPV